MSNELIQIFYNPKHKYRYKLNFTTPSVPFYLSTLNFSLYEGEI